MTLVGDVDGDTKPLALYYTPDLNFVAYAFDFVLNFIIKKNNII